MWLSLGWKVVTADGVSECGLYIANVTAAFTFLPGFSQNLGQNSAVLVMLAWMYLKGMLI